MFSSYYYAYMAACNDPSDDPPILIPVLVFEIIFGISMILQFFLEFKVEDSPLPVRDFGKIAYRYMKSDFIFDVIPLIPMP